MMTEDVALVDLLDALHARQAPIMRDDVQWAFEAKNSRQEAVDFVDQYLTAETLLSQDELELYQRLERNGTVRDLAASHDLSLIRPILDDEIQTAVTTLRASTIAIERQNDVLKGQRAALLAFRMQDKETKVQSESRNRKCYSKQEQEKQHVVLALDELFQRSSMELETSSHRLRAGTAMMPAVLAERLKRDDRLLLYLGKFATGLTGHDGSDRKSTERSTTLCKTLTTYVAEGNRCRLDSIYMENLIGKDWQAIEDTDFSSSVEEEMSSLYSEIAAVAEMSVNHEYEYPLLDQFKLKQGNKSGYTSSVLNFLNATVTHRYRQSDHFRTIIRNHQSHERTVQALLDNVNAVSFHQPHDQLRSPAKFRVPNLDQSVHLLPHRVALSISPGSYRSDSAFKSLSDSLGQLLGLLGISLYIGSDNKPLRDTLRVAALDQEQTIRGQASNQDLTDMLILSHLRTAAETDYLLADILYANSPDAGFRFVDGTLEKRTFSVKSAIDDIASGMAALGLDVLQQTNRTKDEFVDRWTR